MESEVKSMEAIFLFFVLSMLFYVFYRRSAIAAMKEIGSEFSIHPKQYKELPKWVKKHFRLKQRVVHKCILFRLYKAVAWWGILLVDIVIYCCLYDNNTIPRVLVMMSTCIALFDNIVFCVFVFVKKYQK